MGRARSPLGRAYFSVPAGIDQKEFWSVEFLLKKKKSAWNKNCLSIPLSGNSLSFFYISATLLTRKVPALQYRDPAQENTGTRWSPSLLKAAIKHMFNFKALRPIPLSSMSSHSMHWRLSAHITAHGKQNTFPVQSFRQARVYSVWIDNLCMTNKLFYFLLPYK